MFVFSSVITTVAPGTLAFCGSVTVPVIVAERICPYATDEIARLARTISEQSRAFNTLTSPPCAIRGTPDRV
jgi:hypothetical protein